MPGGLVESFIDTVENRRGGALAPTVQINISGQDSAINLAYGQNGLGGYGDIPANRANIDLVAFLQDLRSGGDTTVSNPLVALASVGQ